MNCIHDLETARISHTSVNNHVSAISHASTISHTSTRFASVLNPFARWRTIPSGSVRVTISSGSVRVIIPFSSVRVTNTENDKVKVNSSFTFESSEDIQL